MAAALTAGSEAESKWCETDSEWAAAKPGAAGAGLVFQISSHLAEGFPLGPVHFLLGPVYGAAGVGVEEAESEHSIILWAVMWALAWVSHVFLFLVSTRET